MKILGRLSANVRPITERQHRRADLDVDITLESESNFYAGLTNNVSEGGVFVATFALPPVGAELCVRLRLPGLPNPIVLDGVVRWVRDLDVCHDAHPGCGIEWVRLPDDARRAIERFVEARDTLLHDVG